MTTPTATNLKAAIKAARVGRFMPISSGRRTQHFSMQHGTQHHDWSGVCNAAREAHAKGFTGTFMAHRPTGRTDGDGPMDLESYNKQPPAYKRSISLGMLELDAVCHELGMPLVYYFGTPAGVAHPVTMRKMVAACRPAIRATHSHIALDRTAATRYGETQHDQATIRQNETIHHLAKRLSQAGRKVIIETLPRWTNPAMQGMPCTASMGACHNVLHDERYMPSEVLAFTTGHGVRGEHPSGGACLAWLMMRSIQRGIPCQLMLHSLNRYESIKELKSEALASVDDCLSGVPLPDMGRAA